MTRLITIIIFFQFALPGNSQTNDITLLRDIYNNRNADLDKSMEFISESVTPISILVPATLFVTSLVKDDVELWDKGRGAVLAIGSAMAVSYLLKYTINRDRPYERYPDILPYSDDFTASIPSGHTTSAFATATTLTLLKPEWYVIVPAYGYAALIGYTRMHLGMHYPSDVLLGALIGSGCAFLSFKINKMIKPGLLYPRKSSP